ncbi:general amidase GmdA [Aspergillus luchuensis]|uniref:General amidase GmdA n=1 Tax=Aspergillus kawachii TaxID=1069201 RepID=A0A146FG30_ASPKA|nr:general amidase GmdA [Aspergillus luchuensis]
MASSMLCSTRVAHLSPEMKTARVSIELRRSARSRSRRSSREELLDDSRSRKETAYNRQQLSDSVGVSSKGSTGSVSDIEPIVACEHLVNIRHCLCYCYSTARVATQTRDRPLGFLGAGPAPPL